MTVKLKALLQYKDVLSDYCSHHIGCKYCVFRTPEDEIGDNCPFYVQPPYFDDVYEKHNCFSCEYGKDEGSEIYCMRDDFSLPKTEAACKCDCWSEKEVCAKNATTTKKIELLEE